MFRRNSSFQHPIHKAAKEGELQELKEILSREQKAVYVGDRESKKAIHFAAEEGKISVIDEVLGNDFLNKDLLNAKTSRLETPIWFAIISGQLIAAQYLYDRGASLENKQLEERTGNLLYAATIGNSEECTYWVLGMGIRLKNYSYHNMLLSALKDNHFLAANGMLRYGLENKLLDFSKISEIILEYIRFGDLEKIEQLMNLEVKSSSSVCLISYALEKTLPAQKEAVVNFLFQKGLKVESLPNQPKIVSSFLENPQLLDDFFEFSPASILYLSASQKEPTLIQRVLPKIDLNLLKETNSNGVTILHLVASSLNVDMICSVGEYKDFLDLKKRDGKGLSAVRYVFKKIESSVDFFYKDDYRRKMFLSDEDKNSLKAIELCFKGLIALGVEFSDEIPFLAKIIARYGSLYAGNIDLGSFYPLSYILQYQEEKDFIDFEVQETFLHIICREIFESDFIIKLLSMGLNKCINIKDKNGNFPVDYFKKKKNSSDPLAFEKAVEKLSPLPARFSNIIIKNNVDSFKELIEEERDNIILLLNEKISVKTCVIRSHSHAEDEMSFHYGGLPVCPSEYEILKSSEFIFFSSADSTKEKLMTPLEICLYHKDIEIFVELTKIGADISIKIEGKNLLYRAVQLMNFKAIDFLLINGVGIEGVEELLHFLISRDRLDIIKKLREKNISLDVLNSNGENLIYTAAQHGNQEICLYLEEQGVSLTQVSQNQESSLDACYLSNHCSHSRDENRVKLFQHFTEKGVIFRGIDGKNSKNIEEFLYKAIESGNLHVVRFLKEQGVNLNHSALIAVETYQPGMLDFLISVKVDVNKIKINSQAEEYQEPPLSYEEWLGNNRHQYDDRKSYEDDYDDEQSQYENYVSMHESYAKIQYLDYQYCRHPLVIAVMEENNSLAEKLLTAGADPNAWVIDTGEFGRFVKVLHLAASQHNIPLIKMLLNFGVDANAVCQRENFPIRYKEYLFSGFGTTLNCAFSNESKPTNELVALLLNSGVSIERTMHEECMQFSFYFRNRKQDKKEVENTKKDDKILDYLARRVFLHPFQLNFQKWVLAQKDFWDSEDSGLSLEVREKFRVYFENHEKSKKKFSPYFSIWECLFMDAVNEYQDKKLDKTEKILTLFFNFFPEKIISCCTNFLVAGSVFDLNRFEFFLKIFLSLVDANSLLYKEIHFYFAETLFSRADEYEGRLNLVLKHLILCNDLPSSRTIQLQVLNILFNKKGMIRSFRELEITAERLSEFNQVVGKSFQVEKSLSFQSLNLFSAFKEKNNRLDLESSTKDLHRKSF